MLIRPVRLSDMEELLRMRMALWPDWPRSEHITEIHARIEKSGNGSFIVAERNDGRLAGFIEMSLRSTAESCNTHPVGYIEDWYVDPDARQRGVGGSLVRAGEQWAIEKGCSEMASDTELDNTLGQRAHGRLGYEEVERLVHFRKVLTGTHK